MTFDDYQKEAMRTKNRGELEKVLASHLAVAGLGIAGEAGEVADEIKKIVGHGREMNKDKLIKETGDVLWYVASIADELGVSMSDIAQANIDKLKERYPKGFTTAASVAKADEKPKTQSVSSNVGDLQVLIHFEDGLLDESKLKELLDKCKDNRVQRDLPKSKLDVRELVRTHGITAIVDGLIEFLNSQLRFGQEEYMTELRNGLADVLNKYKSRYES